MAEATLGRVGYRRENTQGGDDFYHHPDSARTVAVGETDVLTGKEGDGVPDPRSAIGGKIDAKTGRTAREHEGSREFARPTEEVGGQPAVTAADGGAVEFGGTEAVAQARGYTDDGDDAYIAVGVTSPGDGSFSESDIREAPSQFPEALDASRVDGRLAKVVAKLSFDGYRGLIAAYGRPLSTWSGEYGTDDALALSYDAGERIDPAVLTAKSVDNTDAVAGDSSFEERTEPTPVQFEDRYDSVEPGASLTADVSVFDEWTVFVEGQAPDDDYT